MEQFYGSYMKLNERKCNLFTFGASRDSASVEVGSSAITNRVEGRLLEVILDSSLTFEQHANNLWQKVNTKLLSLLCTRKYQLTISPQLLAFENVPYPLRFANLPILIYSCMTSGNPSFLWEFFNKKCFHIA